MRISREGVDLIKRFEGLRLAAYRCPAGVLTIGYGHTGPDVAAGMRITPERAEVLLREDLGEFEEAVTRACPSRPTQPQFDAMVSLAFNIGAAAFRRSSVARLYNAGDYAAAARAFALWNKGGGVVLPGLVRRRAAEAAMFLSGADDAMPQAVEGDEPRTGMASRRARAMAAGVGGGVLETATRAAEQVESLSALAPYLPAIRWVAMALIVGAIGYALWRHLADGRAAKREGRST